MSALLKPPGVEEDFIVTLNKMGYMLAKPDEYNQAFIDYVSAQSSPVLDIGCAYGLASIPALKNGAQVFANDLDQRHLNILENITPDTLKPHLTTLQGRMPEDLDFEPNFFGAILSSRVFHFISPNQLIPSLKKIFSWLKPKGKLFWTMGSPFTGNFKGFLPQYEQNKKEGKKWPGFIQDTSLFLLSKRIPHVNDFINLMDQEMIEFLVKEVGFTVEKSSYIPATEEAAADHRYDGRENVGVIAIKP